MAKNLTQKIIHKKVVKFYLQIDFIIVNKPMGKKFH